MADKMSEKKPKDVGAAKGSASPGSDNSAMDNSMKDKQMPGGASKKVVPNESASSGKNSMADRGGTSDEAMAAFKKCGLKAPTSQKDGYR